jgi:hypothetical protein
LSLFISAVCSKLDIVYVLSYITVFTRVIYHIFPSVCLYSFLLRFQFE